MVTISQTLQGFSRLKGVFRSGINFSNPAQIVTTAKNKIIGNLPKDLLNLLIKNNSSNRGGAIKFVQETFEETALHLAKLGKCEEQAIKRFTPNLDNALKLFTSKNGFLDDAILKTKKSEILLQVEKKMLSKFKKVIPNLDNIKISFLGEGAYGMAYKCEFLDNKGVKIISDKVIKSFRENSDYQIKLFTQMDKVISKYSNSEIVEYAATKGHILTKMEIENFRIQLKNILDNVDEDLLIKYQNGRHGVIAEANITEFIRFFQGHKTKTSEGILIPDMFSLGRYPYQISEFISKDHAQTKFFDFSRLGLIHEDYVKNPGNRINNVCIDLGGIKPKGWSIHGASKLKTKEELIVALQNADRSDIIGDKFLMKKLKRFCKLQTKEEKFLYLQELEKQAKKTKNLLEKSKLEKFIIEVKDKYFYELPAPEIKAENIPVNFSELSGDIAKELMIIA